VIPCQRSIECLQTEHAWIFSNVSEPQAADGKWLYSCNAQIPNHMQSSTPKYRYSLFRRKRVLFFYSCIVQIANADVVDQILLPMLDGFSLTLRGTTAILPTPTISATPTPHRHHKLRSRRPDPQACLLALPSHIPSSQSPSSSPSP
jgi:hypothetical protein